MANEQNSLLMFQLGPVQKFIAQAETVGDLRAGSEILSRLTAAALRSVPDYAARVVFPVVDGNPDLQGVPNRFLVRVPRDRAEAIAKAAAEAARDELKKMAEEAWPALGLPEARRAAYDGQVAQFLQTTWAVLKEPTGAMGDDYATIGKLMAMRRSVRAFGAWTEESDGAAKDFLSGKEAALDVADGSAANRNSGRGAMNLIKRARTGSGFDAKAKDALGKYLAVIAMDGDHMGAKLSGFKTQEEHRSFSLKLAGFANALNREPKGTDGNPIPPDGFLIYAGGDDVLAVVKAIDAIAVAQKLSAKFVAALNESGERAITASVGIAIGSTKVPLQDLVHAAHEAESRAKHGYGRDALAIDVYKRSGEILKWGCKFGSAAFDIYAALTEESGKLSRFAYKLASFLEPYALEKGDLDGTMREVVKEETLHTLAQTDGAGNILSAEMLERYLGEDSVKEHPEDYLGLFLCEAFINRPRD